MFGFVVTTMEAESTGDGQRDSTSGLPDVLPKVLLNFPVEALTISLMVALLIFKRL